MSTLIDARFGSLAEGLAAADAAIKQQDLGTALAILTALREDFPQERAPFSRACTLLQQADRLDELEEWQGVARARFPGDFNFALEYARAAQRRRYFDEAARRWQSVCTEFPDEPVAHVGLVTSLREAGQFDAADAAAAAALARFPDAFELLVAYAFVAHMRRDWEEATRRWEATRVSQPEHHIGYVLGARSLRESGQTEMAEALLRPAIERFPNLSLPLVDYAWAAHAKRDWTAALERWAAVRERFPEESVGYVVAAQEQRELQRLDEADELLSAAVDRFPGLPGPLLEYAWNANLRHDWQEAARRCALLRERQPNEPRGWQMGAAALREAGKFDDAEALLSQALTRFPDHEATLAEYAAVAQARSDWATAARRWEELRRVAPGNLFAYVSGAHALRQGGFSKEAEALLDLAAERFPNDTGPLVNAAWMATHRNDVPEAIDRWNRLMARLPDDPTPYHGMAFTLRAARRLDEAEAFLQQAAARFPDAAVLACEYAWVAASRDDWEMAQERWQFVRERFPRHPMGYVGLSRSLQERGEPDLAEQVILAGIQDLPNEGICFIEYAELAGRQRDWSAAAQRWATVRTRFPHVHQGFTSAAVALRELHQLDAAEALLEDAISRFPTETRPFLEYAAVATARGNWDATVERLNEASARFPGNAAVQKVLQEAQAHLDAQDADVARQETPAVAESASVADTTDEMRELVSVFVSLGGDARGSEFGELQQLHDAEPFDLMRWTNISPTALISALESHFDGVGQPKQTEVFVHRFGDALQYQVRDRRFDLETPTFIKPEEASQDEVAEQTCHRMQYLRDQLIQELEGANKIFVYRTAMRTLDDAELDSLCAALRSYGSDTTLLYGRYADAMHPDGTVEVARPNLLIGYLDRFGAEPSGRLADIPFATWAVVCQEAYRLWQSGATRQIEDAPEHGAIDTSAQPAYPTHDGTQSYAAEDEAMAIPETVVHPQSQETSQGGWRGVVRSIFRRKT